MSGGAFSDKFEKGLGLEGLDTIGHFRSRPLPSAFLAGSDKLWTSEVTKELNNCILECERDDAFARDVFREIAEQLCNATGEKIIHCARTFAYIATANDRLYQLGTRELKVLVESRVRELDNKIDMTDQVIRNLSYTNYGVIGIGVQGHHLLSNGSILGGLITLALHSPDRSDSESQILYQRIAQHQEDDPFIPSIKAITHLGEGIFLQEFRQNLFSNLIRPGASEPLSIQGLCILSSVLAGDEEVASYIALQYAELLNTADPQHAYFLGVGAQACYEFLIDHVADPFEPKKTVVRNANMLVQASKEQVQYRFREIIDDLIKGEEVIEKIKALIAFSGQLRESVAGLLDEIHEGPAEIKSKVVDVIFDAGVQDTFAQYALCRSGLAVKLHEIAHDIDPAFARKVRKALHNIFMDEYESVGYLVNSFFEILPFLSDDDFRATMRAYRGAARVRALERNDSDEFLSSTLLSMDQILKRGGIQPIAVKEFVRLAARLCDYSNENFYQYRAYRYFQDIVPILQELASQLPQKEQRQLNQHFRTIYSRYFELFEDRPWSVLFQDLPVGCIAQLVSISLPGDRRILIAQCPETTTPQHVAGALMGLHMQNHRTPVVALGETENLKLPAQMISRFAHYPNQVGPVVVPVRQTVNAPVGMIEELFSEAQSKVRVISDPAEVDAPGFTMAVLHLPTKGDLLLDPPHAKSFIDVQNAERVLLVARSEECVAQVQRVLAAGLDVNSPFGRIFSGREVCILATPKLMYALGFNQWEQ